MKPGVLALFLLPAIAGAQTVKGSCADPFEASVAAGQRISMHLRAGDVEIVGTEKPTLRVTCTGDFATDRVKITWAAGSLRTYGGSNHDVKFRIEIPNRTDLYINLTAGDMRLSHVAGDKDVHLRAGDVTIDIGNPEDYRVAEGSVLAGDIRATVFGVDKGGLFRSFRKDNAEGKYRLHAELLAGDLTLR